MSYISRCMYEEMMERITDTGEVCPLCGSPILTYKDPSDDPTMSEWCSNDDCDWRGHKGGCDHE